MNHPMTLRIKTTHDRHCHTWETWQSTERDAVTRRTFLATWDGCRACGVAILRPPTHE